MSAAPDQLPFAFPAPDPETTGPAHPSFHADRVGPARLGVRFATPEAIQRANRIAGRSGDDAWETDVDAVCQALEEADEAPTKTEIERWATHPDERVALTLLRRYASGTRVRRGAEIQASVAAAVWRRATARAADGETWNHLLDEAARGTFGGWHTESGIQRRKRDGSTVLSYATGEGPDAHVRRLSGLDGLDPAPAARLLAFRYSRFQEAVLRRSDVDRRLARTVAETAPARLDVLLDRKDLPEDAYAYLWDWLIDRVRDGTAYDVPSHLFDRVTRRRRGEVDAFRTWLALVEAGTSKVWWVRQALTSLYTRDLEVTDDELLRYARLFRRDTNAIDVLLVGRRETLSDPVVCEIFSMTNSETIRERIAERFGDRPAVRAHLLDRSRSKRMAKQLIKDVNADDLVAVLDILVDKDPGTALHYLKKRFEEVRHAADEATLVDLGKRLVHAQAAQSPMYVSAAIRSLDERHESDAWIDAYREAVRATAADLEAWSELIRHTSFQKEELAADDLRPAADAIVAALGAVPTEEIPDGPARTAVQRILEIPATLGDASLMRQLIPYLTHIQLLTLRSDPPAGAERVYAETLIRREPDLLVRALVERPSDEEPHPLLSHVEARDIQQVMGRLSAPLRPRAMALLGRLGPTPRRRRSR